MEMRNLLTAQFKTLDIRMLKELSEYLASIKNDPDRNEGYTNGAKQQFRGNQQESG